MLQLNGTARPSLALENLRELEDQKLNGPDRNKVEEAMAGALASMYSGSYPLPRTGRPVVEMMLLSGTRHCKSVDEGVQTCRWVGA